MVTITQFNGPPAVQAAFTADVRAIEQRLSALRSMAYEAGVPPLYAPEDDHAESGPWSKKEILDFLTDAAERIKAFNLPGGHVWLGNRANIPHFLSLDIHYNIDQLRRAGFITDEEVCNATMTKLEAASTMRPFEAIQFYQRTMPEIMATAYTPVESEPGATPATTLATNQSRVTAPAMPRDHVTVPRTRKPKVLTIGDADLPQPSSPQPGTSPTRARQ